MWWQDLLWGVWNGITAWVVFIAHVFGAWERFPVYDVARIGNWYDFDPQVWQGTLSYFKGLTYTTLKSAAMARYARVKVCESTNPQCT